MSEDHELSAAHPHSPVVVYNFSDRTGARAAQNPGTGNRHREPGGRKEANTRTEEDQMRKDRELSAAHPHSPGEVPNFSDRTGARAAQNLGTGNRHRER